LADGVAAIKKPTSGVAASVSFDVDSHIRLAMIV
jgi:hypothetical protein